MQDRFITVSFYFFLGLTFILGWEAISLVQLRDVIHPESTVQSSEQAATQLSRS